jgi:triosephosphate isomerase
MEKKTVRDINVKGKKVLVRVDYNVPMNDKGEITDTIRIDATLPTLNYLLDQGAAIILMAHLGRPKGKVVPSMSLKPGIPVPGHEKRSEVCSGLHWSRSNRSCP